MTHSMTTTSQDSTSDSGVSESQAWAIAVAMVCDITWKTVVAVDPEMDRERVIECACAASSHWCERSGHDRREMAIAVMKSWDEGSIGQMREVVATVSDVARGRSIAA